MDLSEVVVEPVAPNDEAAFRCLMQTHHYLGALPKIGETIWYWARWRRQTVALLSFSAPALKCGARDRWIGWDFRIQYDRLHLITANTRFLILPGWHRKNLGSRVLALCRKRLAGDWPRRFGHRVLALETFVDPSRFEGTVYKADNWIEVGRSGGFQRCRGGYAAEKVTPKLVFVKPLVADARACLGAPRLAQADHHGGSRRMIAAHQMRALPAYFKGVPDPRKKYGKRYTIETILAIASAATLCGMSGYKAIGEWAQDLSQAARKRFGCRRRNGVFQAPTTNTIRELLIRVVPEDLDHALARWNKDNTRHNQAIALDGKTLCNAVNDDGSRTHLLAAVGHDSKTTLAKKNSSEGR